MFPIAPNGIKRYSPPITKRKFMRFSALHIPVFLLAAFALISCAGDEKLAYKPRSVEAIYAKAHKDMLEGDFYASAQEFDEVERQHPYSAWARRALLMAAYSYYRQDKYQDTILTAKRFIDLYPGNKHSAYAYYLIAQSFYEQISDVERDQYITQNAQSSLREVIRRYPDSEYARDAVYKIDLTRDHLAGKEMAVGRYYLKRSSFIAAISRFSNVLKQYKTTTHVPEALHRLVEAYLSMGIVHEAQTAAAILGYNFPATRWYHRSYELLRKNKVKPKIHQNSSVNQAIQDAS